MSITSGPAHGPIVSSTYRTDLAGLTYNGRPIHDATTYRTIGHAVVAFLMGIAR